MELLKAIEDLRVKASTLETETDQLLFEIRQHNRPAIPSDSSRDTVTKQLENSFFQPPTTFDDAWLNRLQQ